jgi:hypothetical protein
MDRAFKAAVAALIFVVCSFEFASAGPFEEGVSAFQRGDYPAAMRFFRPVADQGNGAAQYNVGIMYDRGLGVRPDAATAANWYRKAADQGNRDAQHNLGTMYRSGRGVPQNYVTAAGWFRKAANQGDASSQNNLGVMYENGYGVQTNYPEALKWYRKSADQGNEEARKNLSTLNARFPTLRGQSNNKTPAAAAVSQSGAGEDKASAAQSQTRASSAEPIAMHSGWVTIKDKDIDGGFKVFRRYAYSEHDQKVPFANLIMFMCSKDVTSAASHLTFVLPKDYLPNSFPRDKWLPNTSVRFLIDDDLSVSMPGEYRNGEFHFDLNPDTSESFSRIMLSNKLAMGFGDKTDIVEFRFNNAIDTVFSEFGPKLSPGVQIAHYERSGAGGVVDACIAYQQGAQSGSFAVQTPARTIDAVGAQQQNSVTSGKEPNGTPAREAQSTLTMLLSGSDLPKVVSTYRENEIRFKRDFFGKRFSDVLLFRSVTENILIAGKYEVGFGTGQFLSDLDCSVTFPAEISKIANWNKGDKIRVEGIVQDVVMGSVRLKPCTLSK